MFWALDITERIREKYSNKIKAKKPLVIRDEKTASGRVHVGSLRGVAIHGIIYELLKKQGVAATYLFEINDFDPMDGIAVYLDKNEYSKYLGKPLCNIPSPDGKAKNFAEYYAGEFIKVIEEIGFTPEFYRSSDTYRSGKYDEFIRLAILKADTIRKIYKRISGSERADDWIPVQVVCEQCGKVSTTKITSFNGKEVSYSCNDIEWTKGCEHTGKISPFGGNAKLPWKIEWAAKFKIFDIDVEGAGKDHSTKGGSRDVSDAIAREVFGVEPPFNIPYEFFNVNGKKMSSSKGAGSYSREIADLLPPHILRLLLLQKVPKRVIDFIPDGDTVPVLYDTYDKLAEDYFNKTDPNATILFESVHFPAIDNLLNRRFLPRFSQIAYLVQMPHINIKDEVRKEKGSELTEDDIEEINLRVKYAKYWLEKFAPEDYKFDLKKELPEAAKNLSMEQKNALGKVLEYIRSQKVLDGQVLHTKLHEIRKDMSIEPKDFFEALYLSFLGKDSGPKAGWFFSVMDKSFVESRLAEASK
jgi:lysyl-tRNA synthetase class 1